MRLLREVKEIDTKCSQVLQKCLVFPYGLCPVNFRGNFQRGHTVRAQTLQGFCVQLHPAGVSKECSA